ncbi:MAG: glycoside hydrolase, partial [Bacilli bacterium]
MKNNWKTKLLALSSAFTLVGCTATTDSGLEKPGRADVVYKSFEYNYDNRSSALTIDVGEQKIVVSEPQTKEQFGGMSYRSGQVESAVTKEKDYLSIQFTTQTDGEQQIVWPKLNADAMLVPMGHGKRLDKSNEALLNYVSSNAFHGLESLSMQFVAAEHGDSAVVYILENPYNNELQFHNETQIGLDVAHTFTTLDPKEPYTVRVYVTENNPASVAKVYRNYLMDTNQFKSFAEKIEANPNVEKLLGAPHIYLWNSLLIDTNDIHWPKLKTALSPQLQTWIETLVGRSDEQSAMKEAFQQFRDLDYTDKYTQSVIVKALTFAMQQPDFYNADVFPTTKSPKVIASMTDRERLMFHKQCLADALGDAVRPVSGWTSSRTTAILDEWHEAGLERAWFGLDDWTAAYGNPALAETAKQYGYLFGTYDSYHSIHKPGAEEWITAKFNDTTLFDNGTVMNKDGNYIEGF